VIEFKHEFKNIRGELVSEVSMKIYADEGLDDIVQEFRRFLLAVSFQPGSIDKYIEAE
jgi:hypothetical protein